MIRRKGPSCLDPAWTIIPATAGVRRRLPQALGSWKILAVSPGPGKQLIWQNIAVVFSTFMESVVLVTKNSLAFLPFAVLLVTIFWGPEAGAAIPNN